MLPIRGTCLIGIPAGGTQQISAAPVVLALARVQPRTSVPAAASPPEGEARSDIAQPDIDRHWLRPAVNARSVNESGVWLGTKRRATGIDLRERSELTRIRTSERVQPNGLRRREPVQAAVRPAADWEWRGTLEPELVGAEQVRVELALSSSPTASGSVQLARSATVPELT